MERDRYGNPLPEDELCPVCLGKRRQPMTAEQRAVHVGKDEYQPNLVDVDGVTRNLGLSRTVPPEEARRLGLPEPTFVGKCDHCGYTDVPKPHLPSCPTTGVVSSASIPHDIQCSCGNCPNRNPVDAGVVVTASVPPTRPGKGESRDVVDRIRPGEQCMFCNKRTIQFHSQPMKVWDEICRDCEPRLWQHYVNFLPEEAKARLMTMLLKVAA